MVVWSPFTDFAVVLIEVSGNDETLLVDEMTSVVGVARVAGVLETGFVVNFSVVPRVVQE